MTFHPGPVLFDIDLTGNWKSASWSWTDFSYRIRETQPIEIRRERAIFTSELATGSAGLLLDNSDGWASPKNPDSPLWPSFPWDPLGCPARLYDLVAGVEYPLYRGFVNVWTPTRDNHDEVVAVELVDAWGIIAPIPVTASFPEQLESERIEAILDAIGWPAALRDIESGIVTLQASEHVKEPAMQLLKQASDSGLGFLFVDAAGRIVFHNQDHRISATGTTIRARFSDSGAGLSHGGLGQTPLRRDLVRNTATVQRIGGVEQSYTDAESEEDYGPAEIPKRDNMLMLTDDIALSHAQALVSWEREPLQYVARVPLIEEGDLLLYDAMVTLEPGDAIHVEEEATGGDISEDVFVESVSHSIGDHGENRATTLQTSPAAFWATWILGDDIMSILGETTILGINT